jgi:hypothetical protein
MDNIKRGFVRGIWGVYDINKVLSRWYSRRTKIDNDIVLAKLNPYAPPCRVYIFGEDNYKKMTDMGFDTVLADKKPFFWDMEKEQYRHKIEIWRLGLKDFDEIIFLDWDCVPCAPIPSDIWDVLGRGEKIRSTIFMYKSKRAFFRTNDARKVSSSTFVYMRGKETADDIIKIWEKMGRPWNEESALSKYIDEINGGWKGVEDYKMKYEPPYHTLFYHYGKEYLINVMMRHNIFYHLNCSKVAYLLGDRKPDGVKGRLDGWQVREKNSYQAMYNRLDVK